MAFPVHLLLTWAHCDAATVALQLELRVFTVRDSVLDLRTDQSIALATGKVNTIESLTDRIAELTTAIAGFSAGSVDRIANERLLKKAKRRLEDLTEEPITGADDNVAVFLKAVDVRQVVVQVPELETALAEVAARRLTLTA